MAPDSMAPERRSANSAIFWYPAPDIRANEYPRHLWKLTFSDNNNSNSNDNNSNDNVGDNGSDDNGSDGFSPFLSLADFPPGTMG